MNRKLLYFTLPLIALVLMSCRFGTVTLSRETMRGSGNLKTEQRQISDVERVSLEGMGDLTIIQGSEEGLTIEADDNILPILDTHMNGRELVLGMKDGYSLSSATIRYTLKVKSLNQVSISGAGNVTAAQLKSDDLRLNVAGAGNIKVDDLQTKNLRAQTSGTGNFDLAGKADSQDITITGAGNYNAGDLQSSDTHVVISGAGDATVWTSDKLDVRITGFGNVNYYGSPNLSQNITGGGSIKSRGEHK